MKFVKVNIRQLGDFFAQNADDCHFSSFMSQKIKEILRKKGSLKRLPPFLGNYGSMGNSAITMATAAVPTAVVRIVVTAMGG